MEGFKKLPKGVACFKEGGSVYKSRHSEKKEVSQDIAKDKQIVKKAVSIHDKQQHEGEKTDLSKLKKGGRAKKDVGTVKKYKSGGTVENAYGTPKTDKDIKDIANTKRQKPKKMQMGGMTGGLADGMTGGGLGGMAAAPSAPMGQGQISDLEKRRMMEKMKRARALGPGQQSELIKQSPAAAGLVPPPAGQYKKGGKIKKCAEGGSLKETNAEENPGLAKLPTNVRNKMGYAKKGGKVC
jgi:hypothetical protein